MMREEFETCSHGFCNKIHMSRGTKFLLQFVRSVGTPTLCHYIIIWKTSCGHKLIPRKDKKTAINCMKTDKAKVKHIYVFSRGYIEKTFFFPASIVLYLHRNYSGTCVFKEVVISCQTFYKSFLTAVDGNPATPAMNDLQCVDPTE